MGKDLIDTLILYSGLPEAYVKHRLYNLIARQGLNAENLSLNDIREVAVSLLQDIILNEANDEC